MGKAMKYKRAGKVNLSLFKEKSDLPQNEKAGISVRDYVDRLIKTHEQRIYPKGIIDLTDEQRNLYEVIESVVRKTNSNIVFRVDILSTYTKRFGSALKLLPTDFCYNLVNQGPDFETKFLLAKGVGEFEFVGFDWQSDDAHDIKWIPRGRYVPEELKGKTFKVGTYRDGRYVWDFSELEQFL
jgi:hypothetical protein